MYRDLVLDAYEEGVEEELLAPITKRLEAIKPVLILNGVKRKIEALEVYEHSGVAPGFWAADVRRGIKSNIKRYLPEKAKSIVNELKSIYAALALPEVKRAVKELEQSGWKEGEVSSCLLRLYMCMQDAKAQKVPQQEMHKCIQNKKGLKETLAFCEAEIKMKEIEEAVGLGVKSSISVREVYGLIACVRESAALTQEANKLTKRLIKAAEHIHLKGVNAYVVSPDELYSSFIEKGLPEEIIQTLLEAVSGKYCVGRGRFG